jgi:hypothetical protein
MDMNSERLSRRSFLGAAAAAPLAFSSALRGLRPGSAVPVGLELYSVRTELAKDLLGTVAAVGHMGYQVAEFYAPYLDWTVETAKNVRKALDDSGLVCHSTHNNGPSFTPEGKESDRTESDHRQHHARDGQRAAGHDHRRMEGRGGSAVGSLSAAQATRHGDRLSQSPD